MKRLKDVELDEISLVDTPANKAAKVVLMKRKSFSNATSGLGATPTGPGGATNHRDPLDGTQSSMVPPPVSKQPGTGAAPASPSPMPEVGPGQSSVHVNAPLGSDKKPKRKRVIGKAPDGVKFTIGFPKDGGGSKVQSVMFDSDKWDKDKASAWLKDHEMKGGEPDVTANMLRFRQEDPSGFSRFRVITPGAKTSKTMAGIAKILNNEDSWNVVQSLVGNALREKFSTDKQGASGSNTNMPYAPGPWIRDFFNDYVVYDYDGQTCRLAYDIREDATGENIVEFTGSPEIVDVVYMTEKEMEQFGVPETQEAELQKRQENLSDRLSRLAVRFLQEGGNA